ncbi:MAG: hypothetical protein IJK33_06140 [Clostridia bacterium]|nr:hypothetical protein [Clostridia bacterium]
MKYFFGTDITQDKQNETLECERFVSARADAELEEKIAQASKLASEADELCRVSPVPRKAGQTCAVFAVVWGILLAIGLIRDPSSITSTPMIVTMAMVVISAVAAVFMLARAKKQLKTTPEQEQACERANAAFAEIAAESDKQFGIPEDCKEIDTLYCVYTVKDGVAAPYTMFRTELFMNYPRKVFVKDGDLCISDMRELIRVPASSLGDIEKVERKCGLGFWNKSVSYRAPEYAAYDIKRGGNGILTLGSYIRIDASLEGETYALLFPPYEEAYLKNILGR